MSDQQMYASGFAVLRHSRVPALLIEAIGKVTISHKAGEEGKLFGSVGTADIADAIEGGLRRRMAQLDLEQSVTGLDALDELALHARLADCLAAVDFKRLPPRLAAALATRPPYRSQRSFGSVALDWCWLAAGRHNVYLHGGQKLWDYAAGQLILRESGATGGLLDDYRGDWARGFTLAPRIAVAASDADLLARWRDWIAQAVAD